MKRLVASRKLKRKCRSCGAGFNKGAVYYKHRVVYKFLGEIQAFERLECAKCEYKNQMHLVRLCNFLEKCHHPITEQAYETMPGEPHLLEPSHEECSICHSHL